MRYRIGEFAELSGVTAKTLRFYDQIGLLRPAGVDSRTRYRQYLPEQLQELAAILALKDLGASLPEIRQVLLRARSSQDRERLLKSIQAGLKRSIQEHMQALTRIDAALNECRGGSPVVPVIIKRRPPTLVAAVRVRVSAYADILQYERDLLDAVPDDCTGRLRGVLWHSCADSGVLEGEPFVELRRTAPGHGRYEIKQLPPVTVACAYSSLDDRDSECAYDSIRRWMHAGGYRLSGPKREIYFDNLLEIQFPLESN